MKSKIIAKRYAEGFLDYATKALGMETIVEECKNLKLILTSNVELLDFFENYGILLNEKYAVIDEVFKEFSKELRSFLGFLLEKDRFVNILGVCDYIRTTYAHGGTTDALLKTTYPLDLELIQAIKDRAENKLKKRINLHIEYDANLLGGVQLTVGNLVIDGSVRKRLDQLKEKLDMLRV